ncbi:MAG: hypothetical protein LBQ12_04575 [Deltaproteobacteria bacterium]|nr:hypothetical protein [Deltaproteobacteria bacterium]
MWVPGDAAADQAVALGWESPGGGVSLAVAIRNGYFREEGVDATAVKIGLEDFAEAIASGKIVGGELDGLVLGLYRDGARLGPSAGLYSGFLEILGSWNPTREFRVAAESLGGGPAVAAARRFREMGVDPDTGVEWVEAPSGTLMESIKDGKADAVVRWELERAGSKAASDQAGEAKQVAPEAQGRGGAAGNAIGGRGGGGGGSGGSRGHGGRASAESPAGREGGGGSKEQEEPEDCEACGVGEGSGGEASGGPGGGRPERPWKVIYSASESLPPPSGDGKAPQNRHARHTASHHFFASFVVLGRELYERDPALAAAVTRAWVRGASWTGENLGEAARIGVEYGVWEGGSDGLERELARYMWMPGVAHAKEHLKAYVREWIKRGLLPFGTDGGSFFEGLFVQALPDLN